MADDVGADRAGHRDNAPVRQVDLARLEALERAATPGEWAATHHRNGGSSVRLAHDPTNERGQIAGCTFGKKSETRADAELIAALRTAAPWLLAQAREAERLQEEVSEHDTLRDLMRRREQPWIERWQAATGQPNTLPDYGVILAWIADRAEAAEREAERLRRADTLFCGWCGTVGETQHLSWCYETTIADLRTRLAEVERERDQATAQKNAACLQRDALLIARTTLTAALERILNGGPMDDAAWKDGRDALDQARGGGA